MTFDQLIQTTPAVDKGTQSVVLTSRIRLARNLANYSFPGWSTKAERTEVYQTIQKAVSKLPIAQTGFFEELSNYESLQKQVLVEQHLMSRELASRGEGCGLLVNKEKSLAIMINEEDHFRLQAIHSGLNLKKAYRALDKVDTQISKKLDFAYDHELGFLTSCPTNVGTGMRASVMLHLPALGLTDQIEQVLKAVSKLGLAIRGFYGEGTESLGDLYQISNQSTLGESEKEIIGRIERVVKYIATAEENARLKTLQEEPSFLFDKVSRAYGTLRYAHILSSKESLTLISLIRMGTKLGYFPEATYERCDNLTIEIQPAHLQLEAGKKLSPHERDLARAKIIARNLKNLSAPKL